MKNWQDVSSTWMRSSCDLGGHWSDACAVEFPSVGDPSARLRKVRFAAVLKAGKDYAPEQQLCLRVPCVNGPVRVLADGEEVDTVPAWTPQIIDLSSWTAGKKLELSLEVESTAGRQELPWGAGEGDALSVAPVLNEAPQILSGAGVVLEDVLLRPDFFTDRLRVSMSFFAKAGDSAQLSFRIQNPDGKKDGFVRELVFGEDNPLYELEFEVPDAQIWTTEQPRCYQLELSLGEDQVWKLPFGFAAPVWNDKGIFLNEQPLFLRGVRWDAVGPAGFLACADPKAEFACMKEAGFNAVVPAKAPFPESFLPAALQAGLLVIQNLGLGGLDPSASEAGLQQSVQMVIRQEYMANVLGFTGADIPGRYLERSARDWLKNLASLRQEFIPRGVHRDFARTVVAHCAGTRLEVGHSPQQDAVPAAPCGARNQGALEIHRFRLPAPVSVARQNFLARHLHPKDPSDLISQGLGDALFWKKLHKSKTGSGKFLAACLSVPSPLDPESSLKALRHPTADQQRTFKGLADRYARLLTTAGVGRIWTPQQFAAACQQVGGQALLRQADALAVNPRCAGWLVNQWADTPRHASGLVGLAGQPKPGFDWFRKYNRHTRVIADAVVRTPYTMQSAGIRIYSTNEMGPGDYSLLLRIKGNNGRIWHQESLTVSADRGLSSLGKFEFPVGDEKGSFSFDMQMSCSNRDIFHTVEAFYVPSTVPLDQSAPAFRQLGDFPAIRKYENSRSSFILADQIAAFNPQKLKDLLDETYAGCTLVLAPLTPEDARFLNRHGDLNFSVELHPGASAGGEGYHYLADSPLLAHLPVNAVANEVYADLLPAWSLSWVKGAQNVAGFVELEAGTGEWNLLSDIQILPYGKGRIIFYQYDIFRKLGESALADALFGNLADFVRG